MKLSIWSNFYYDLKIQDVLKLIKEAGFNHLELSENHMLEIINRNKIKEFYKI